jgi:type IV pilus assembly protein PilA
MKKMNRKGFTIVELVIVIAVIAILAGVLIPTFGGIVNKANDSKALQEAKNIHAEWLADFDYKTATPSEDVIVVVKADNTNGQYAVLKGNQFQTTIYKTMDKAKEAFGKEGFTVTETQDANNNKIYTITVTENPANPT